MIEDGGRERERNNEGLGVGEQIYSQFVNLGQTNVRRQRLTLKNSTSLSSTSASRSSLPSSSSPAPHHHQLLLLQSSVN